MEAVIFGLYINPLADAAVFCFDERTQMEALESTQPSLPMMPKGTGTMTYDLQSNGTLDLFAALNVGSGRVLHATHRSLAGHNVLALFRPCSAAKP